MEPPNNIVLIKRPTRTGRWFPHCASCKTVSRQSRTTFCQRFANIKAGEIAGLTLNAEWVVLSACNTAAGDGEGAEGLSGLASAFFAAGAEALLVSHWPVRDDAAARLTAGAFAQMRKTPDLRKAEALRRSMLTLLEEDSDPTSAHPFAWAPFFMVGNS